MKLIDFLREFKYVEPRDEAHYRELMKALQDIQNNPDQYAQVGKMNFMKRKAALDAWADANLPKSEDGVQPTDMKRMGAMGKTLYVHKNGKTIMIPAEREKEFIQKGFQRSALRTEDDTSSKGMNKYGLAAKNKDGKFYSYRNGKLTGTFDNIKDLQKHQHDLIKDESFKVDERMPASIIKHKEKLAHMSDKELADRFKDKDDNTLRQMAWRHGYGKMSDYYVNRKNKGMSQDTNEGEMRLDKTAFVQMLADKIKEPQKGHGRPEYDNRLLAKMYKLITGKDVDFEGDKFTITMNKPTTEDLDYRSEDILNKAGFDPADIDTYVKVFNDHGDTSDIKQMNMKEKVGLADAMSIVLASHGISNESVNEGTYLDEGWLDTLKAAGRKIVPDQVRALYDPATAAKVQADDQAKVQMQTLFKDINTVVGLNQTDVSQGYPADLIVAYLRKYVGPKHPDAFKRMDAQGDLKKMFAPGSKISAGTLKGNLNKVAIELGKVNLSPDQEPAQKTAQQTGQQPQPQLTSIDNDDSVKEGASMIPYFKTEKELDGEKTTVYEFPMAWSKDKELDTPYLSNASMREFLTGLGYSGDFEDMSAVPIDEFIGVSTQWLKKNIGKPSPEEPTTVDKNPDGPTMISGGKPEGYMNQQVKLHNELARKIKSKYPEVTHLGFN